MLAGLEQPDDAAVWKLDEQRSLVVTTDFFTPVVDDSYDYGAISAANSLSDIYAMGGMPFMALNIAAFPPQLPVEIASEILRGGAEKARKAGVVIAGGHTIQDKEPKYGLVALGFVQTANILNKGGIKKGDCLFLSKPIGSGVISTAIKNRKLTTKDAGETIGWMKRLNAQAARIALENGARAATDITGFSLLGHAWEMALASRVGLRFKFGSIPLYPHVKEMAAAWSFPGGGYNNAEYFGEHVRFASWITKENQMVLFDPQTSGGLLFAVPQEQAEACHQRAEEAGVPIWQIGTATDSGVIEVTE